MKGPSWLVVIVSVVFELVAFGLALGAMTRRSKAEKDISIQDATCIYTSKIATGLAAGAIIMLVAGHTALMIATGCLCCGPGGGKGKGRACAILSFILAWITFIIAIFCLLIGAIVNANHSNVHNYFDADISCKEVRKSVFATAAAFTFLSLIFGEMYYFTYVKSSVESWDSYKNGNPTISMTAYP